MFYNCKTIFNKCKSIYLKNYEAIFGLLEDYAYLDYCRGIYELLQDNIRQLQGKIRQLQENLDNCMPKFRSNIRTNVKVNAKQNLTTKNV